MMSMRSIHIDVTFQKPWCSDSVWVWRSFQHLRCSFQTYLTKMHGYPFTSVWISFFYIKNLRVIISLPRILYTKETLTYV